MQHEEIIKVFKETGVMLTGHFLLTSGRHSAEYMQCAQLFQYPDYSEMLCRQLAKEFIDESIDLVIGPALGGIIISYEMSRILNTKNIFAERQDGVMSLRRGFQIPPGANVLVVEDVITTGGSVKEVIGLVKRSGANVAGVGVIVDRSGGQADFGCKLASVIQMRIETFDAENCPLCQKNEIPVIKPGSRAIL